MEFKSLHYQEKPLVLANVWDLRSIEIAENLNFGAVGTSSAAMSKMLGYKDGEEMKFSELLFFVEKMAAHTKLPITVDLESGYSRNPKKIVEHIKLLADVGVSGINIEDSIVKGGRHLLDIEDFSHMLSEVIHDLQQEGFELFLNVRTDAYLLNIEGKEEETIKRIQCYENAGAHGIFVPCVESIQDISKIVASTALPVNVMCMPNLPDFETLGDLGVKRISMGDFLFNHMYLYHANTLGTILEQKSFRSLF